VRIVTELGPIESWNPGTGPVTVWTASAWSRGQMRTARKDPLPPSAQQAQHLMLAHYAAGIGRELPRLMIVSWYEEGICDLTAMTEAINIHVRRHDTYRSAFEIDDHNTVQRRTLDTPDGVEFIPTAAGFMTNKQIRAHALSSTPATLDWDCFTFGMIQHADHFTVYASIDHLHIDGTSAGLIFGDIHLSYRALVHGLPNPLPPISGYRRYTARQQARIAAATPDSPQITGWLDFARNGDWPGFPLPLGDTAGEVSGTSRGGWVTLDLLDAEATDAFDTACRAAGARFSGGVMACAALAEHELTGTTTYRGLVRQPVPGHSADRRRRLLRRGPGRSGLLRRQPGAGSDAVPPRSGTRPGRPGLRVSGRAAANDVVLPGLPQDSRRRAVGGHPLRHLRRQHLTRRDQPVGQPASGPDDRDGLVPRQPYGPTFGAPLPRRTQPRVRRSRRDRRRLGH
jgi:hypothetical protein